jgi:UDP-4-amino-4,6-dideoxy-N-acetyl-beta-L-altrosamine N-acetyltransferase
MLRSLEKSDLKLILPWRNAPTVRQAMFTQDEISWNGHQAWFHRMQADDTKRWFLYLNENIEASGVVYFTDLDDAQRTAFWGFYARPDAMPGTGLRMSLDAIDKAFNDFGLEKLNADVLATNSRSLDMHKKVGFTEEGFLREHFFDGEKRVDVIRLRMLSSEWPENRVLLDSRIGDIPR